MFLRRWFHRLIERYRRKRQRREYLEMRDAATYFDDQVAGIDIEIVRIHAEMEGLILTRNMLAARRDDLDRTINQTEALYRQA